MDNLSSEIYEKYFDKNKILHAYLFIVDDYDLALEFLIKLALKINDEEINEKNIENVKLSNNFDINIIDTDKNNISKENIVSIEKKYSTKSLNNKKRIYIINEAYKMNRSSSNTLLKFLEEPEEDIISFIIVKNKNMLLDTILSRCIKINLNLLKEKYDLNDKFIKFIKLNKKYFYLNIEKEYANKENLIYAIEKTFEFYNYQTKLNLEQIKFIEILFDINNMLKNNINYKTIIDKMNYSFYKEKTDYELL